MTPQEISDYKMGWAPGFEVPIHSDHDWRAKIWCRKNVERHRWSMDTWTASYQHTFRFEKKKDANAFMDFVEQWDER